MNVMPIRVTEDGVLIPREYLPGSNKFEFVLMDDFVLVRPQRLNQPELLPSESKRFSFVGIAETRNPKASEEVEEILQQELGRRQDSNGDQ